MGPSCLPVWLDMRLPSVVLAHLDHAAFRLCMDSADLVSLNLDEEESDSSSSSVSPAQAAAIAAGRRKFDDEEDDSDVC